MSSQKIEKRRLPPALSTSVFPKKCLSSNSSESTDQASLIFFRKYGDLIKLRRAGKSLEEIAIETGGSRLGVFRALQKLPSRKLKIQLGIPT
jgi:hypothetical protein